MLEVRRSRSITCMCLSFNQMGFPSPESWGNLSEAFSLFIKDQRGNMLQKRRELVNCISNKDLRLYTKSSPDPKGRWIVLKHLF